MKSYIPSGFDKKSSIVLQNTLGEIVMNNETINMYKSTIIDKFKPFYRSVQKNKAVCWVSGTRAWEYFFQTLLQTYKTIENIQEKSVHLNWSPFSRSWFLGEEYNFNFLINTTSLKKYHSFVNTVYIKFIKPIATRIPSSRIEFELPLQCTQRLPKRLTAEMFQPFLTDEGLRGYSIVVFLHKHDIRFLQVTVYNAESKFRRFDELRKSVRKISVLNNTLPFLNDYGLSLFQCMQTMPWKGRDLFCFNVLETFVSYKPLNIAHTFYKTLFYSTALFDTDTSEQLFIKHIRYAKDNEKIDQSFNEIEAYIIEMLRPNINACISCMNTALRYDGGQHSFVFVGGGDAFERYIPVGQSKDIDVKIVYEPGDYSRVYEIAVAVTADLVEKLKTIISTVTKESIFFAKKIVRLYLSKCMLRLRFIDDTVFPVNLLSVDIRCPLEITYRGQRYQCMHDIAALDVVFIENGTSDIIDIDTDTIEFVKDFHVASPSYLTRDLQHIYENANRIFRRWKGGKRNKDKKRFQDILKFTKKFRLETFKRTFRTRLLKLNKINKSFQCKMNDAAKQYALLFFRLHDNQQEQGISKHKLPFAEQNLKQRLQEYKIV